jgi:dTDP-glucose 4,6-dehydratase
VSPLKILVIGSNSFSGSHFVAEALRHGHQVWGVSRSPEPEAVFLPYRWSGSSSGEPLANDDNFSFAAVDLNTQLNTLLQLIDRVQPAVVVNFAAQGMVAESWLNPTHWYRTNVVAQVALHDALRQKSFLQKYVHVTTPEVYGSTDGGWIKEHTHFAPSTPYAVRSQCVWPRPAAVPDHSQGHAQCPHEPTNATARRGTLRALLHSHSRCGPCHVAASPGG